MYLYTVTGLTRQKKPHLERALAQWARYKSPRIASIYLINRFIGFYTTRRSQEAKESKTKPRMNPVTSQVSAVVCESSRHIGFMAAMSYLVGQSESKVNFNTKISTYIPIIYSPKILDTYNGNNGHRKRIWCPLTIPVNRLCITLCWDEVVQSKGQIQT